MEFQTFCRCFKRRWQKSDPLRHTLSQLRTSSLRCLSLEEVVGTCKLPSNWLQTWPCFTCFPSSLFPCSLLIRRKRRMYIYHALINALSAHTIHINLNMIFGTHVHVYNMKNVIVPSRQPRSSSEERVLGLWMFKTTSVPIVTTKKTSHRPVAYFA